MWVGPFIMGSINTRAVRRSNALQDWAYGPRFRYREVMGFGSGPVAAVQAGAVAGGVGALVAGLSIPPARAVLDRVLPSPGEGPEREPARAGLLPHRDPRADLERRALPLPRRRPGRPGV